MTLATLEALSVAPHHCRIQAWAGSTLVHGLCVCLTILLITDLQPSSQSEPLRLDIAFIQPAPPEIHDLSEPQELPKLTRINKKVIPEKVIPPTLIPQPMIKKEPVIEEQRPLPTMKTQELHHSDLVHQPPPEIVEPTTVRKPLKQDVAVPIPTPERIQEPVQAQPILTSTPIKHEVVSEPVKQLQADVAHSKPIEQLNPNQQQELPLARRKEASNRPIPTVVTESPEVVDMAHNRPMPFESVPEPRSVNQLEVSVKNQPIQKSKEVVEPTMPVAKEEAMVRELPVPQIRQRTAAVERPLQAYPQTQADYGWLAKAIWNQIEKYKRYPTKARQKEWEGKVVLEAVIHRDGTILNLRVSETSGHEILDQDALNLLWKLSPLTLYHVLGRPQITILVPLTYQLDG